MTTNLTLSKTQDGTPVIDTVTIAEGAKVSHETVIKLVRKYATDFEAFERVRFEIVSFETAGGTQRREIAQLTEDQATLLFTYLKNTEIARALKVRVVKAFRDCRAELAQAKALAIPAGLPNFTDPAAAALAWAEQYKKTQEANARALTLEKKSDELEAQAAQNAPKVAFADGVTAKAGTMCITSAAKVLGIGPRKFADWLRLNGFLYKQSNQAMQAAIEAGYMVVRFAGFSRSDGKPEEKPYAHITGKGLYHFYQRLLKDGLIAANQNLELAA